MGQFANLHKPSARDIAKKEAKAYATVGKAAGKSGSKLQKQDKVYGITRDQYAMSTGGTHAKSRMRYYGDVRDSLMRNVEMRKQSKETDLRQQSEKNIAGVVSQKARAGRKIGTGRSASLMAAIEGKSTRYRGL
jgi:cytolysin (calcineurin-like family phosphatase)